MMLPIIACCASLGSCIKFGDDIEVVAPAVTVEHLRQVERLAGIRFPEGSTGLGYHFLGSGIDDALAIKVEIPAEKRAEFLQNAIFTRGRREKPSLQLGGGNVWWTPRAMVQVEERTQELSPGRIAECAFGAEDGRWVAYICWYSS
jgi:hypothetical protein